MSCNEWKRVKLEDVINFNPKESIKKGEIVKKISMDKLETFTRKISEYEECAFTSGTKFRNGDTLLARITPCLENGKTAQVDILEENEVAYGSTEFIVLREKQGITLNNYIYYLAISPQFREIAIKSMNGSSGRQRVQKDVLCNAEIYLPCIEEQDRISKVLASLDKKIELNNEINKTLEEMAQALFKRWFVDFEFPNEEGKPYKSSGGEMVESEMGLIPKGWKFEELQNISSEIVTGKTPSTKIKENYIGDIPFVTIPDMHDNVYIVQTERNLSEKAVNNNKILKKNSLIVSCIATPGLVSLASEKCQTNQQINSIIFKDERICYYMYYTLKSLSEYIKMLGSSGSATLNLNKTQFSKIRIKIPCKSVINKYYLSVHSLFEKILLNQKENINLINIRDSLLPKLMSGEIRVDDIEANL